MTENELLDAIRLAQTKTNDEGLTSEEIAELMGISRPIALQKLKPLAIAGKLIVGRKSSYRLDGVPCKIPVYRIAA